MKARFIALEGVKASGKTTFIEQLHSRLAFLKIPLVVTKEPTSNFNLNNEELKHGEDLANLIVVDRRWHLLNEIEPTLDKNINILSDRYVMSSLIYRKLDGISFEETWEKNKYFRIPDMTILFHVNDEIILSRRKNRLIKTRYARDFPIKLESSLYLQACDFLTEKGYYIIQLNNNDLIDMSKNIDLIAQKFS